MAQDFVRIELDRPRKLRYQHRNLREAVRESGKSIMELFGDPFGGWPYLLRHGLLWQDSTVTVDRASDLIDDWVHRHREETTPLDTLGKVLLEALEASGFVKIQRLADEGNAPAEAATTNG